MATSRESQREKSDMWGTEEMDENGKKGAKTLKLFSE